MGLDWNPGPKAKAGCEKEFFQLWEKLHAKSCFFRERKVRRFLEITQTAFETLAAPRVGFDEVATNWAREAFPNCTDKSLTEQIFVERMRGFYVLDSVSPCDGLPRYTNGHSGGYVERHAFRAQFLKDCVDIIGKVLLEEAYVSKLPGDTIGFGEKLLEAGSQFAAARNLNLTSPRPPEDPDSVEFRLDVVMAAGKWCRFWAERGHWLEAYW